LKNIEEAKNVMNENNLLVGTIDTWLIWNFTKGECHYTDVTNASRTMLYNINEDCWDDELLKIFNINKNILPDVKNCVDDFGSIDSSLFGEKISIGGVAGDQQAATIGQACFKEGMVKSTYGTGCFLLMNTGNKFIESKSKLLSTKAYNIFDKKDFALEGSIFNAGTVVQWMRDEMNFINDASKVEELANNSTNEIQFIPAFTGLGAPYWNSDVRGQITGITRDTF
jgi:Glycerol kinase